jgi:hypothetical protein
VMSALRIATNRIALNNQPKLILHNNVNNTTMSLTQHCRKAMSY